MGGTERQLVETAISLDRRFFVPHVGAFHAHGMRARELAKAGVPVVEFPVRSFLAPSALSVARSYVGWLRRNRIVLVHAFDPASVVFGVPLAKVAGVPVALSSQRGERRFASWQHRRLLRIADVLATGVVANSQFMRHMLGEYGVSAERVSVCYNGVDTSLFHPGNRRRQPGLEDASCVIGCIAVQRPEKQLDTLISAFAEVRRRHPAIKLVLVGNGECRASLEAQASSLGLGDSILFVPASSEVTPWYRSIDIFVLPSSSEAFSNSLLEAMACGCCVVASKVGGNVEAITAETGVLFDSGNVAQLAEALGSLIENPARREQFASQAAKRVAAEFGRETATARLENLYKSFLAR